MSDRFNPPTRDQLALIANGDQRALRALEQLFDSAGQLSIDALNDLAVEVAANNLRIKTNEVLLWLSM